MRFARKWVGRAIQGGEWSQDLSETPWGSVWQNPVEVSVEEKCQRQFKLSWNWVPQPSLSLWLHVQHVWFSFSITCWVSQDGEKLAKGPDPVYLLHPDSVWEILCVTTWALASCILEHGNAFRWEGLMGTYNPSLLPCRGWVIPESHPSKDGRFFSKKVKTRSGP